MSEQHYWVGDLECGEEIFGPIYAVRMGTTPFAPNPMACPKASDLPVEFRAALREWLDSAEEEQ